MCGSEKSTGPRYDDAILTTVMPSAIHVGVHASCAA